ncbi:hypothetical protein ACTMTJ_13790 [Phytohabitans sp. LJ34]|uniref:hypothetical protein n=1 Tax=Phytohabitans sp. LJ34 TaxID=3452217 RepID=UPI003F888FF8
MPDAWIVAAARPRPASVAGAAVVMVSMAVVGVVASAAFLLATPGVVERFRRATEGRTAFDRSEVDVAVSNLWWDVGAMAACLTLFAAALVALAVGDLRGRQRARVTTWVLSGLGLVYASCVGLYAFSALTDDSAWSRVDNLGNLQVDAYPDWWVPVYALVTAVMWLGQAIVVVLLALPGSHPYFRDVPVRDSLPYPDPTSVDWSLPQR